MDERGWKIRDVADESEGALSTTTVHALVRGERHSIQFASLAGLAKAFGVKPSKLIELVQNGQQWIMPPEFDAIPPEIRRATERYLRLLWKTGGLLPDGT